MAWGMGGILVLFIGLCYIALPVAVIVLLIYFFRQRRKEKQKEAQKDYSTY